MLSKLGVTRSLAATFDSVYIEGTWGEEADSELFSGVGSRGDLAAAYCRMLAPEIARRGIRSLVDVGCGDFRVGGVLAGMVDEYTGIDVSRLVIRVNQRKHAAAGRRFMRADATRDELPGADAAVVRQVLQHLSNEEVGRALENVLQTYPVVFITEHQCAGAEERPNLDIPHGCGTRIEMGSAVVIDQAPFEVKAEVIGDIPYVAGEFLRTWVVTR